MDDNFIIAVEEEEHFLKNSLPSMHRVFKSECNRGRKSKFNRKNRHNELKSKERWSRARKERIRQKMCSSNGNNDSDTHYDCYDCYDSNYYNEPVYSRGRARSENNYHGSEFERTVQRNEWNDMNQILPAGELGIEEGSMYDRLISILEGDDITPEDYDLLRLLDSNNATATLDENEISKFQTFAIGAIGVNADMDSNDNENHYANLLQQSSKCDICLESWSDLPKETEVRCLPCNHVFCKNCIDDWLSQRSQKCPNLSCYWAMEEGETD
mmetsp:Transcript_10026/g.12658  ORF Transcript_10026/g.12658 Transcript_10026/m.12658 type:complete len:270 (-) Transcript_10026:110-919(-)